MQTLSQNAHKTNGRKPRLQRVAGASALRLTASRREILALLCEYGFLTPRLLALAYGSRAGREGRGYWHLQRELRFLFDAGLVQRFPRATLLARRGSEECIYAITHLGGRAILDRLDYAQMRHDLYGRESKQRRNFEHHLALATLQLILSLGLPEGQLVEFRAEERNPRACARVRVKNRSLAVWPDARAVIESASERGGVAQLVRYVFELDLTRKNNQRIEDRFAAYAAFLRERVGEMQRHEPRGDDAVVFAVACESEVERFMRIAGQVLSELRSSERPTFLFWNMEDWYRAPADDSGLGLDVGGHACPAARELRPPAKILSEARLATVDGAARTLVAEGGQR